MKKKQRAPAFDMALALTSDIKNYVKTNNKEPIMNTTIQTEYLSIIEELVTARVSLRVVLNKISELHTRFTAVDFDEDSDEEKEEIEERISKLEDALEEFEDEQARSIIQNKIEALHDLMDHADNTGKMRDDLKDHFTEIAEELDDVDLDME